MQNAELGRKVLDVIDMQPELFDMGVWGEERLCGTVACLAGHALLQSGEYYYNRVTNTFHDKDTDESVSADIAANRVLGMTADDSGGILSSNGDPLIWRDYENGPDRFRKLVEEAEGRQDF